jgi:hypothetical protein
MTYVAPPLRVAFGAAGWVAGVEHDQLPGLSYLQGAAIGALTVDGRELPPVEPSVSEDVDELELVHTYPEVLRLVVRHTFAAGWGLRLTFVSLSERPQQVQRAELLLEPGPATVAWALTLGVPSAYAIAPDTGTGPLLGCLVRLGSFDRTTDRGWELSPFQLRRGARLAVQLQWDGYDRPRDFPQERYGEAPSALVLTTGETALVRVDEDVAVLAPDAVDVLQGEGDLELGADTAGRHRVELRSARGTTVMDLRWVEPVADLLTWLASEALARPRTAAGVVSLRGVADALLVQQAMARLQVDDPDEAAEALDLFTARLQGVEQLTPLQAAYLCREFDRVGDPDLLEEATRAVLSAPVAAPGLGLAATQLCLGLIITGRPAGRVLAHLGALAERAAADQPYERSNGPDVGARVAALELLAVTSAGVGLGGVGEPRTDAAPLVAALGLHLGAGLKGQAVRPLPLVELSHLVAVFQLLPEPLSLRLAASWGCSAGTLARRATTELLARLECEPISDAHAWLVLGQRGS